MQKKPTISSLRGTTLAAILIFGSAARANAQQAGDFSAAYGFTALGQARTAATTADFMAGTASFGVILPKGFLLAVSTQTFTSTKTPGADRTWGYGVTKLEGNHDWTLWKAESPVSRSLHFQADYTITLPTDGNEPSGVEI
jgi:hypothetical protein